MHARPPFHCPALAGLLAAWCLAPLATGAELPSDDPLARYGLAWTKEVKWANVVSIAAFEGATLEERLEKAQAALAAKGGGVVYFPAGEYRFSQDVKLKDGVVLRGATPAGATDARHEGYAPPTRFEFPKYEPKLDGDGTPNDTAFKGIGVEDPAKAGRCGLVNLSINRGHVKFAQAAGYACGRDRFVVGCVLRNAAVVGDRVPDKAAGQKPWQRYTNGFAAAIGITTAENALVANNRLPESTDSFVQPGYVLLSRGRNPAPYEVKDGVVFDFDNRPGIEVNPASLGGGGGEDPKGDPQTMPWGFRKGIVIRDNFIYSTGRSAIHFTGDGTIASGNVIRFKPNVPRPTNTGVHTTSGSSTNDNRAMTIRGWRWVVENNDYEVYRNRCADGVYYINDGEGLMHEGHANCTIRDSRLVGNKGNAYVSLFLTAGIDGLVVEGNDIRPAGPGTDVKIASLFIVADRNKDRHFIRNVRVAGNVTSGATGIRVAGAPAEDVIVEGNRNVGPKEAVIQNAAGAVMRNNEGYRVEDLKVDKPLADPNRPTAKAKPATAPAASR